MWLHWMRRVLYMSCVVWGSVCLCVSASVAGVVSFGLEEVLKSARPEDRIPIILTFQDRVDTSKFEDRDITVLRTRLIRELRQQAADSLNFVQNLFSTKDVRHFRHLWIINGFAVAVPPEVVGLLADDPGVEHIKLDVPIKAPTVSSSGFVEKEWNLRGIYANLLWDVGYTGQNVVLGSLDTGVDIQHPLLQGQWRGGTNSWFDPNGEHDEPYDRTGHGTQVMGIMVAGEAPDGTAIGVAPGARWIAAKIFNDAGVAPLSSIHAAFQWLLDPDGDPETDDAPDVVVNSWEFAAANQCVEEFQDDMDILRTAGIALVFVAGNFGPNSATSASPGNNRNTFSVGSVDFFADVSDFSSRGPSACDGRIYPDLAAPGEGVETTDLSLGGFPNIVTVDGTSMAAPHAAGAMALLLSAFPEASIPHLESALRLTAFHPLCAAPDNDYGYGIINVFGAYLQLVHTVGCPDDLNRDGMVDGNDMDLLAREFGESDCESKGGCGGDMNFDNRVDGMDLSEFAYHYNEITCPVYPLPYDLPEKNYAGSGCTAAPSVLQNAVIGNTGVAENMDAMKTGPLTRNIHEIFRQTH